MTSIELTLALVLIILAFMGALVGAYFFGYSRGSKLEPPADHSTPEQFIEGEVADVLVFEGIGYLEPTTGPISISTATTSLEIVAMPASELEGALAMIDRLTAQLAKAERLRKRYLRLLRQERAMMLDTINGVGTHLTPYWRRWVHDHFDEESPFWLSQSWARIANIS